MRTVQRAARVLVVAAAACAVFPTVSRANGFSPTDGPDHRIIVKFSDHPVSLNTLNQALSNSRLTLHTATADSVRVYTVHGTSESFGSIERELETVSGVVDVSRDGRVSLDSSAAPNDPYFNITDQWSMFGTYGVHAQDAWSHNVLGRDVVVAVIDTGIVANHDDLSGRILSGYDFVSDPFSANDGDGWDADPSDPGDWNPPPPNPLYDSSCAVDTSSWHGTHVSGIIAADADNSIGIAGIAPLVKILPVRVLGRCGGSTSDIAAAIRWAAGVSVPGASRVNSTPAQVINLSLGGTGYCSSDLQGAINEATANGALVVVAAGNENTNARYTVPASCANTFTVAATDSEGLRGGWWNGPPSDLSREPFSNYGSVVDIAAPGVDILSTVDSGATSPAGPTYGMMSGTSQATPHTAAVAALVYSVSNQFSPSDVATILKRTATPFPVVNDSDFPWWFDTSTIDCSSVCGAGIVNAGAAVPAALHLTGPPSPPRSATSRRYNNQVTVSWSVPSDPAVLDAANLSYLVTGSSSNPSDGALSCSTQPGDQRSSCALTRLSPGATISNLRVFARNSFATSEGAVVSSQRIPSTVSAPTITRFTNVTATATSARATVHWTFNSLGSFTPTSFRVTIAGLSRTLPSVPLSSCGAFLWMYGCTQTVTGLTPGTTYAVTVRATTTGIFSPQTRPQSTSGDVYTSVSSARRFLTTPRISAR